MRALLLALQVASGDSAPLITLDEALQRSARLDPNYVAALGQVDNAEWGRRQAWAVFLIPAVTLTADYTRADQPFFNFGTAALAKTSSSARVDARLDVFTGGQHLFGLRAAAADLEAARAGATAERFSTALRTESDYYSVLAAEGLTRAAENRVRRAGEQLVVARARVRSGAAVQTDSLQTRLEEARAEVALLREQLALRTTRLQLGRRVGIDGPVSAAPLDTAPPPPLPFSLEEATRTALAQGPEYQQARLSERAAQAFFNVSKGSYLPRATLGYTSAVFDENFFPQALSRSLLTLTVTFPLWDNANREITLTRARVNRDVARALRADLERAAQRDVGFAYDTYETARAALIIAEDAVVVARENFRVQDTRYRSGATTIIEMLDSQVTLTDAEVGLVQARHAARLALAGLEAILGQRIFPGGTQ